MVTPKQLDFSSSDFAGDSDDTLSRRKSPRTPNSKHAASNAAAEPEEETKKKKKKKKKLASSVINRIWNEEEELVVLKGLVDYRAKTGFQTRIDWDGFYRFVGGSIVAKFSKEQFLSKIRKLKRKFLVHLERINQGNDPNFTRSSDSEAFGFSMMLWGQNEAESGNDDIDNNGAANGIAREAQQRENGEEMLKEHEEVANVETLNTNGAAEITDNRTAGKAQDSENCEEMLKEHEEVGNVETLNENGAAKIMENGTAGKESHGGNDELCAVRDAFETMMSQGLSDYQKKLQLEKLMKLGTGKRRELSDEWKALCFEERTLNIKKLRFSAKLGEAANDS